MLQVSQQIPVSDSSHLESSAPISEPEALPVTPVELAPELRKKLQQMLEHPDFEIQIPRGCLVANVIKEKLKAIPPSQRLQRLEQLMQKLGLERVVVIDPKDSTALVTCVDAPAQPV